MSRDALALDIFCNQYGITADPERYPQIWAQAQRDASDLLDGVDLDEGGEG